jgi:nucleotide-binding universal stress UspA family protein
MIQLDRILCPTDGSDVAEQARRHALFLADACEAEVHVVHVEERETQLADVIDVTEADVLEDLHLPPVPPEASVAAPQVKQRTVVHPSAAGGIRAYAAEKGVDLIVMGTHGRRGVERLVMGSVAQEVVRRAAQPVLTIGANGPEPPVLADRDVLVPVDFSSHQKRLLAHARGIAEVYGMGLVLLHVVERYRVPDAYGMNVAGPDGEALADRAEVILADLVAELRGEGETVVHAVRSGHPVAGILDAADDFDAGLLAIASHGRSGLERMLMGSVSERVVRRARCPVFTVKSFGHSLVPAEDEAPSA